MLAVGGTTAPPTVRDAVLARAARLKPEARAVLDAIAIVPSRVEMWLLDRLVDEAAAVAAVDDCVDSGVLRSDGDGVMFRHELARLALRDAVTPVRRRELHQRALAALAEPPTGTVDEARVAHHAFEAGDAEAVLAHAPLAADQAARVGAHRQAAEHLEHAVRFVGRLSTSEQIGLWRRLGLERHILSDLDGAIAAFDVAVALCRSSGELAVEGELLSRMGTVHMAAGRQRESERLIALALDVLERLGPTPELAYATLNRSAQHMLAREFADAERWGLRAIDMAERLGRGDLLCRALIQSGIGVLMSGDETGHARILRGIDVARDEGIDDAVALGYSQIGSGGGEVRRYDLAIPALETCLDYCLERDLAGQALYARSWLARCYLEQGRWREAGELCTELLRDPWVVGISRMVTVTVVGRLRARRGDPGVWAALDESLVLARENGHLQRLWPTAVVRAEAAWLAGHLESQVPLLEEVFRWRAAWPTRGPSASSATGWPGPGTDRGPWNRLRSRSGWRSTARTRRRRGGGRRSAASSKPAWCSSTVRTRRSCGPRSPSSRRSGPSLRPGWLPTGCGSWAPASHAAPTPPPAATPPGSPGGSSRWLRCSPKGCATPRSPNGSSSLPRPSTTTYRRCSPSLG